MLRHAGGLLRRPDGPDRDQAGHHPRRRGHAEAAQAGGARRRQGAHLHRKDAHGGRGQGGEGRKGTLGHLKKVFFVKQGLGHFFKKKLFAKRCFEELL